MSIRLDFRNIPQALRQAGNILRSNRKLPEGFEQKFHGLMRRKAAAIGPHMCSALQYNPAPGTGRLLAEVLVRNQLELSSRLEIIGQAGEMLLRFGDRRKREIEGYFAAAAFAIKDADIKALVQYLEMAEKVGKVKLDAKFCVWWIKTKNMNSFQAAVFLAEMDIIRGYGEAEGAALVSEAGVACFFGPGFIGRFAALKKYTLQQTCELARLASRTRPDDLIKILKARKWSSLDQVARALHIFIGFGPRTRTAEASYLVRFCQGNEYSLQRTVQLMERYLALSGHSPHQEALFINKVVSIILEREMYLPRYILDLEAIGKVVRVVAEALQYDNRQRKYLAAVVVRQHGLKGKRARQLWRLITS